MIKHIVWSNGTEEWTKDSKLQKIDGPALIFSDGVEAWYKDNKSHRADGPARIFPDGLEYWFRDGEFIKQVKPKWFDILSVLMEEKYDIKIINGTE